MEVCLGSCQEAGVSISVSSIRDFQVKESFIEAIWYPISFVAVLPNLQEVNRRSIATLCPSDSCLKLAGVSGENSVEQDIPLSC